MKNVVGLIIKAGLTMALVACAGQSSDPLKDYKDVKAVPEHEQKSPDQTAVVQMFKLSIDGASETNYGHFTLNKAGQVNVRVSSLGANNKIQKIESATVSDFAGSNQPRVGISGNMVSISWTPKSNEIQDGGNFSRKDFKLSVIAVIAGQRTGETIDLTFTVSRDVLAPKITGVSGLKNLVANEGTKNTAFSVIVEDPNSNGKVFPQMMFPEFESTNVEAYMADASPLKRVSRAPVHLGGQKFQYFYTLDLEKLPENKDRRGNIDANSSSVKLCLNMVANSVVGQRTSAMEQECFEANYSAQASDIKLDSGDRKVVAGVENKIGFKITTENSKSSVAINNAQKQIANLNGTKNLECSAAGDNNSALSCTLTWTPVCGAKISQNALTLKLNAESTLGKAVKKTSIEEVFTLDNSSCEAQAKAKADADQKAKEEKAAADAAKKAELEAKKKADAEAKKAEQEAKAKAIADKKAEEAAKKNQKPEQKSNSAEKKS